MFDKELDALNDIIYILSSELYCTKLVLDNSYYYIYRDLHFNWLASFFPKTKRLEISQGWVDDTCQAHNCDELFNINFKNELKMHIFNKFKINVHVIIQ